MWKFQQNEHTLRGDRMTNILIIDRFGYGEILFNILDVLELEFYDKHEDVHMYIEDLLL